MRCRLKIFTLSLLLIASTACNAPKDSAGPDDRAHPSSSVAEARASVNDREAVVTELVAELLEETHLRRKPLNDEVSAAAFERLLDALDLNKVFLIQADVDSLRASSLLIDDQLHAHDLPLVDQSAEIMTRRLEVVRAIVDARLATPFDLERQETYETDREQRSFCSDDAALAERWRKSLKLQVMQKIARFEEAAEEPATPGVDPPPATFEAREAKARAEILERYHSRFDRLGKKDHFDRLEVFINAVAGVYDPYTRYMPPARKENFDIRMSGSLEGIGAVLSEHEHFVKVVRIVPGSASWRQGDLEADDLILAVADAGKAPVDVANMRLNDVVRLIRGPKGKVVTLTVKKQDDRVITIPITRDVVQIEASYAKGAVIVYPEGDRGRRVGYIDLPSFYGNTRRRGNTPPRDCGEDVKALLEVFNKDGVDAVILDLRGNGGGFLSDARQIAGLFFDEGPVVQTRSANGDVQTLSDTDAGVVFEGDVIVMVDRFSASASEIVAGALQDYKRAWVIGPSQTHGKGTVQHLVDLDKKTSMARVALNPGPIGFMKLTQQQFFRINGDSTQHRGVIPDLMLPDPSAHIESGERHLKNSIPWSSVEKLNYATWPAALVSLDTLAAKSKARVDAHEAFKRVNTRVQELQRQRKETLVSLHYPTWKQQRDADRASLDALTVKNDDRPVRFSITRTDYDGALARQKALEAEQPNKTRKVGGEDREDNWESGLTRDPWVEEVLFILSDMKPPAP